MSRGRGVLASVSAAIAATALSAGIASAGPPTGVALLKDINPAAGNSFASGFHTAGGLTYFAADDGSTGRELWASSGTPAGTVLLKDINPLGNSNPSDFVDVQGSLFFTADDGTGRELWRSDGTEAGTVRIKDINPAGAGVSSAFMQVIGDTVFFRGAVDGTDFELWKSNGTEAGTVLVKAINPDPNVGSLGHSTVLGDTLIFGANDGTNGGELWRSDGTAAGTMMVADINPAAGMGSSPLGFKAFGGFLYFQADDGTNGPELWRTDGSPAGTTLVKDIDPGPSGSYVFPADVANGLLFLRADTIAEGSELWRSDGTAAGTVLTRDIDPTAGIGSSPEVIRAVGDQVLFGANDGTVGHELWRSDGTEAGTTLVKDINDGGEGLPPASFRAVSAGGILVFSADGGTGIELWRSDGTAAGTALFKEINPGPGSSFPRQFYADGSRAFFLAENPATGAEPYLAADVTPPETSILTGPEAGSKIRNKRPALTFASDDNPASFECSLVSAGEASAFVPCSGPEQSHRPAEDLADGRWSFAVRAIDDSRNVDPTPATRTFTVDTKVKGAKARVAKRQRQKGKKPVVKAKVSAKEAVGVVAKGTIKIKGQKKAIKLKPDKAKLERNDKAILKLSPEKKKRSPKILNALDAGKAVGARLKIVFRDDVGNRVTRKAKTKLLAG